MIDSKWEEVFPKRHKNDTHYKFHCVDCGKLLYYYALEFDGHETYRGDLIEKHDRTIILDGLRCMECTSTFKKALLKAYMDFLERRKNNGKES